MMSETTRVGDVHVCVLFERIGFVCREIGLIFSELESCVSMFSEEDDDIADQKVKLQNLDIALQSIEELAQFMIRCKAELPEDLRVSLDTTIPLVRLEWIRGALADANGYSHHWKTTEFAKVALF